MTGNRRRDHTRRALAIVGIGFVALGAAPMPDAPVPVLDRAIARGQLLATTDFIDAPDASTAKRGGLQLRDAVGMEATRNLPSGGVVRSADVTEPRLVRRGEAVTITLRSDGLVIVTAGRALGSAATGEPVRVVALATNRTLDAVVEGSAAVRVAAP